MFGVSGDRDGLNLTRAEATIGEAGENSGASAVVVVEETVHQAGTIVYCRSTPARCYCGETG